MYTVHYLVLLSCFQVSTAAIPQIWVNVQQQLRYLKKLTEKIFIYPKSLFIFVIFGNALTNSYVCDNGHNIWIKPPIIWNSCSLQKRSLASPDCWNHNPGDDCTCTYHHHWQTNCQNTVAYWNHWLTIIEMCNSKVPAKNLLDTV